MPAVSARRSHEVGLQGLGRGRGAAGALLGRVRRASHARHPGHPLRDALEPSMRPSRASLSAIRERVAPSPGASFAIAHAEQGFTANVPPRPRTRDAILATHADGEPLTREHGWPLRLVVPGKYFWKSAKWLRGIEFLASTSPVSGSATATTRGGPLEGRALRVLTGCRHVSTGPREGRGGTLYA